MSSLSPLGSTSCRQVWMSRPTLYIARPEDIGPALKDLRLTFDVSQRDHAEAIDMHPSHVGSYERGTVIPRGDQLLRLLSAHDYVIAFVHRSAMP